MENETITLHLFCDHPPAGMFGLQTKDRQIIEGELLADGRLRFRLELKVKQTEDGQPNFTGPYAHGSVNERFLYLTLQAQEGSATRIVKRIKVHLKTITWEQVEAVLATPASFLQAEVDGRGTASVPLLGDGWTVETA